jgi:hypothetical protein
MANVFTDAGEALLTDIVDGTASVPADWYVGWGTGAGTAAKADTTLFSEASEARVAATMTQPTADANRFTATLTCAGAGKTITNAGVFNASTTGTLLLKSDFTGVALEVGDSIQFVFTWTHS